MVAWLVAVGAATVGILVVLLVALGRHVRLLAASLQHLREDLEPVLRDIRSASEEAQGRLGDLQRRRDEMARARMRRTGG